MRTTQETVAAPPKQLDRVSDYAKLGASSTTAAWENPGRGIHINCASGKLQVQCSDDPAPVVGYYVQGMDYSREVINVLTEAGTALSAGDVTILI